ncbi:MAG: phosphatase [Bacillota bacterium]|nr:phosphatase [Bacillota bacterium]MDW7682923.1 phosphatase [Bacillota bacterium]
MRILADLHIHTIASGHAYSTIEEVTSAAGDKGLELVAITDHGPAMPGGPHEYYFGNLRVLPPVMNGVKVLQGVEANIMDERGRLDLREIFLTRLDLVLAGLHNVCIEPMCREKNTLAMVNALRNPFVDIVVHPGNPDFPIDMPAVISAVAEQGKALEINNSSFLVRRGSYEPCLEIARLAREADVPVSISSDAHISRDVGALSLALDLALAAGIPEKNIINLNADRVERFLALRQKRRFAGNGGGGNG